MLFFKTRTQARSFKAKSDKYRFVDMGSEAAAGRRWAVKVL